MKYATIVILVTSIVTGLIGLTDLAVTGIALAYLITQLKENNVN